MPGEAACWARNGSRTSLIGRCSASRKGWDCPVRDKAPCRPLRRSVSSESDNPGERAHWPARPAFSLLELVVVLAVTVLLTAVMLPALSQVRLNVDRVLSAANLRQLGLSMTMYAKDEGEKLPYSQLLTDDLPLELMAAHIGDGPLRWDGLGLLYSAGYCRAIEVFYCPAYKGEHTIDQYEDEWLDPGKHRIYTNYHYCGHREWQGRKARRRLDDGERLILAADGFRTLSDLSDKSGMNMLRGDGSVRWRELTDEFMSHLPLHGLHDEDQGAYLGLWKELADL